MISIGKRIFIGDESDCGGDFSGVTVHACRNPCWAEATGVVKRGHSEYLMKENGRRLYLNMIDPDEPVFELELFERALSWMELKWRGGAEVLIHCNKGVSRSPSLALLLLARLGLVDGRSYDCAWDSAPLSFVSVYEPRPGIEKWLRENWRKLIARKEDARLSEEEAMMALRHSAMLHFATCVEVELKNHKWSNVTPNVAQAQIYEAYEWLDDRGVPVRILLLKPRQVGGSTVCGHICYHHTRRYGFNGLMMADENSRTDKVWTIFNRFGDHDNFCGQWESRHEYDTQKARFLFPGGKEALWERDTATDPKAGAAGTRQIAWFSEAARYAKKGQREDKKVIGNVLASIPNEAHTLVFAESTAEGLGGWFREAWDAAVTLEQRQDGQVGNGWVKVFAAWHEFPEYSLPDTPENAPFFDDENPDWARYREREERGRLLYKWAPGQLAWRRKKIAGDYAKNEQQFDSDFPESEEVAWSTGGSPMFDIIGTAKILKESELWHDTASFGRLEEQQNGALGWVEDNTAPWLWVDEFPTPGHSYLAPCDAMTGAQSAGSKNRDCHAACVLRAPLFADGKMHGPMIAAAIWVPEGCRWDEDILAERLIRLSRFYGDCMIVPEANQALGLIRELCNRGAPVYEREKMDEINPRKRHRVPGWLTDRASKKIWISSLREVIREQTLICRFLPAAKEFCGFIENDRGSGEARAGEHDDWCASIGIGLTLMDYAGIYQPQIPYLEIHEQRAAGELLGVG